MDIKKVFRVTLLMFFCINTTCYASQTIVAKKVSEGPVIDGVGNDAQWEEASGIVTHDTVADIDLTVKAVYTDKDIFFLVSFPDKDESRLHKAWTWDKSVGSYKQGPTREDTFIFKWNMMKEPVDLSIYSDDDYVADIWFWKANRTDPMGFADDKIQMLKSVAESPNAREIVSKSRKDMHLLRLGDEGREAYANNLFIDYKGDTLPRYNRQTPTGSRADIKAKGVWSDGRWTIEFARALDTGNVDDIQFSVSKSYLFGVSRYEIAARPAELGTDQPLYGCGDVGEELTLKFGE